MTDSDSRTTPAAWLAGTLLVGTGLLGAGALLHPMLPSDVAGQLAVIAGTIHWRAIHVVMLAGSVLVIIGLWGLVPSHDPRWRSALRVIFGVIVVGVALNATNIAFMAAIGTADAARYGPGHAGAGAAFAAGHMVSLMRARAGNALVALACAALAAVEWRDARQPRWMAVLAALAAVGGGIGVVAFDPASRGAVAAVALFSLWAAVCAIDVLRTADR
jgi:hypothetical protein